MNEILFKNIPVLAPNFKKLLLNFNEENSTPLISYLINTSSSGFSDKYRGVSCGNLDYTDPEIDLEDGTSQKAEKNVLASFTPKGKNLFVDEESNFYGKTYRVDGNIGTILKQLVEFDSTLIKCKKKEFSDKGVILEDLKYKFHVKDESLYLFDPEKEMDEHKESNYQFKKQRFPDSMYEDLVNRIKSALSVSYSFEIVKGSDIVKYYNEKYYDNSQGTRGNLHKSCMRHNSCSKYIKFYENIPEASMLIIKKGDKIVGRTMIWDTNFGKYMDRRYTAIDFLENKFIEYAKKNKWHYKTRNSYENGDRISMYNFHTGEYENLTYVPLIVKISNPEITDKCELYPYADTLQHYHVFENMLTNYNRASPMEVWIIRSTDGGHQTLCDKRASMFYGISSEPGESSGVINQTLSNIIKDDDIYGLPAKGVETCVDFEGRTRIKRHCNVINGAYVPVFNEEAYNRFKSKNV